MDQIAHRILWFDRFALDLTRGCLRAGGEDILLRPKAFDVLRHLAENAGRLVPKQELCDAVWPGVAVSDDSLVQCIRELRSKLGDDEHCLIKTVPRRGYLLDAALLTPTTTPPAWDVSAPAMPPTDAPMLGALRRVLRTVPPRKWAVAAAACLLCVAVGAHYLSVLFAGRAQQQAAPHQTAVIATTPANQLFTEKDAGRISAVARSKELPLPAFQIDEIARDIPDNFRRFVGVWVSDKGWTISTRQFMLIVTTVDINGGAAGYAVNGPAKPKSPVQGPAYSYSFRGRVLGGSLAYVTEGGYVASMTIEERGEFKLTYPDGTIGIVALDPIWTLLEAERAAVPQQASE